MTKQTHLSPDISQAVIDAANQEAEEILNQTPDNYLSKQNLKNNIKYS